MRDIRFRAWDKRKKIMLFSGSDEFYYLSFGNNIMGDIHGCHNSGGDPDSNLGGFENYDLMQYTGLKDKNGTPIFEDDIVKIYYDASNWYGERSQSTEINKVSWGAIEIDDVSNIECWSLDSYTSLSQTINRIQKANEKIGELHGYGKAIFYESYIEVIGNIYENPELLK